MYLYFPDFQKLVNRQHIVLKHEVKNIQDRLDIIMSLQEKMNERLQGCVSADNTEDSFDNTITRVDTVTDLNDLEDKLLNDTVFKKKLVLITNCITFKLYKIIIIEFYLICRLKSYLVIEDRMCLKL